MRVRRGFVYAGVFLVALGAVLLAADAGTLDPTLLTGALRLWPLAFIAVGGALLLRRTPLGLPGGMLAAAMPGLLLGSGIAFAPRYAGTCNGSSEPALAPVAHGAFFGSATVEVHTGCGALDIHTQPGSGWDLQAGNTTGSMPSVRSSGRDLVVDDGRSGIDNLSSGRDRWTLTLPATDLDRLRLGLNAQVVNADLAGARIGDLDVAANAATGRIDASRASVDRLSAELNLASLAVLLGPDRDVAASIEVNAGAVRLCLPDELGFRLTWRGAAENIRVAGDEKAGRAWESNTYATAAHHADIDIRADLGSVDINPIGGCAS
jgi:hypothetical protein